MIERSEIIKIAKQTGVHAEAVELEYVNGLFVDAISGFIEKSDFAIHGGTCRNKAFNGLPQTHTQEEKDDYFKQNRFSSDIDSYISVELNNTDFLKDIIYKCSIKMESDYDLKVDLIGTKFEPGYQLKSKPLQFPRTHVFVPYFGPMYNPKFPAPKINLTLDSNEPPVLNTTRAMLYHPFSDADKYDLVGNCVSFPELFANKWFALCNRKLAKDLYDVGVLAEKYDIMSHMDEVLKVIKTKQKRWNSDPTSWTNDIPRLHDYLKTNWDKQMPKIVSDPIDFEKCFEIFVYISGVLISMQAKQVLTQQKRVFDKIR